MGQPSLFDSPGHDEAEARAKAARDRARAELTEAAEKRRGTEAALAAFAARMKEARRTRLSPQTYLDGLREQALRDAAVLRADPVFWVPSREFFEGRLAAYLEEIEFISREGGEC